MSATTLFRMVGKRHVVYGVPALLPENTLSHEGFRFAVVPNRLGIDGTERLDCSPNKEAARILSEGGMAFVVWVTVHTTISFDVLDVDTSLQEARSFDRVPCGVAYLDADECSIGITRDDISAALDAYAAWLNGEYVDILIYELTDQAADLLDLGVELTDVPGIRPVDSVSDLRSEEAAKGWARDFLRVEEAA